MEGEDDEATVETEDGRDDGPQAADEDGGEDTDSAMADSVNTNYCSIHFYNVL